MTIDKDEATSIDVWSHSEKLSSRVKKLREQFYSFDERTETNEPYAFSTRELQAEIIARTEHTV